MDSCKSSSRNRDAIDHAVENHTIDHAYTDFSSPLYGTLINLLSEPVMVFDSNGIVVQANEAAVELHGFNPVGTRNIDGARRAKMRHPDGTPVADDDLCSSRALKTGKPTQLRFIIDDSSGRERHIRAHCTPIFVDGKIDNLVSMWHDFTEIKLAQDELESTYRREHHICEVLQQALLPVIDIDQAGFQIAGEYHACLSEAEVGGDFYDVFAISDDWMAVVMGDVAGKGLGAAVYTSMAKYMIRAYALEDPEPKTVLRRLNQALSEFMADDTFITIFCAIFDTRRHILIYANAGHEPPVIYMPSNESAECCDVTGPAVGMLTNADYTQRLVELQDDSILAIFTDGISDARQADRFYGIEGLTSTIVEHAGSIAKEIACAVYRQAYEYADSRLSDDAAILVLRPKQISAECALSSLHSQNML